jgi:hypothetical protein
LDSVHIRFREESSGVGRQGVSVSCTRSISRIWGKGLKEIADAVKAIGALLAAG